MTDVSSLSGNGLDGIRWKDEDYLSGDNKNTGQLTQEDFFALLTKELSNQDPTKPTDNNQMIAQMTAFSTNDGINSLNEKFDSFNSMMTSSQALQASSLVGRSVLVENNSFYQEEGMPTTGKLVTEKPVNSAVIYVENTVGELVQTVPIGDVQAGEFPFTWDGLDNDGNPVPEGAYRFRIAGIVDGEASEVPAMTYRKIESVNLGGNGGVVMLNLKGGNSMKLSDVVEVAEG